MRLDEYDNPELRPTGDAGRDLSFWDYALLWAGMTINLGGFSVGGQLYPNMTPVSIILAVVVAYSIVSALLILNGDMGLKYGIPFAVYLRSCFGYRGSLIPAVIRSIPCFFWFGFQTWIGALAVQKLMVLWFGTTYTINLYVLIGIFAALQVWNSIYGLKAMAKFDWLAIPLMVIFFSVTIMWLLKMHGATVSSILAAPADNNYSFPFAVAGIAGVWITMALNSADLGRKLRRPDDFDKRGFWSRQAVSFGGQLLGLIIIGSLVIGVGMVSGVLTGEWNPIDVVINAFKDSNPIIMAGALMTIVFAQWSTNTAANLMPPTYILLSIFPKLSFAKSTVISALLGLAMCPWLFADRLIPFQVGCSVLLGPIIGIMLADYYLIKKTRLNVDDLYNPSKNKSYEPAAMIVLLFSAGLGLACAFFIPGKGVGYSFYAAFIASVILYPVVKGRFSEKIVAKEVEA
ncbi:MAG: cytosine permease [Synergistota bacterium]|nr:cytosine permease [Synergistota bacterium]